MTRRLILVVLVTALLPIPAAAGTAADLQWIVVTAPAFRTAVERLCRHRQSEGIAVKVVQTTDALNDQEILAGEAGKLRRPVNKLCKEFKGRSYVLLVGAVEPGTLADPETKVVPALPGAAGRMKGQPTDNGYGCTGEDLLPAAAVGRFPAQTAREAEQMVAKTLAFERDRQPGEWRRRLTIFAGIPAYNPLVDRMVESLALTRFERLDLSWSGRAIYHNPESRFCVPNDALHDRALAYVQQGQAITLYLGHSSARGFYSPGARFLDRDDWATLKIPRGSGVFATFGCNGCQQSGDSGEGYGVAAFRNPAGPAAVLGSHGICFAAMVQLAADGLFESLVAGKPPERLGEGWLGLKKGLAEGKIDDFTFRLLDAVDGDSNIAQSVQRREHLEMFLLLGDPALRLPVLAQDVGLRAEGTIAGGETLAIKGEVPARLEGARVRVTIERPLTSLPGVFEQLPKEPEARARTMLANHDRANRFALASAQVTVRDGKFATEVKLPAKLPWARLIVRAYAATATEEAAGVIHLAVKK